MWPNPFLNNQPYFTSSVKMKNEQSKIYIKVYPGASKNAVTGCKAGVWQIKVAAQPEKGKANEELVDFLADILDTSKSSLSIEKGLTSRNKVVAVDGVSPERLVVFLQCAAELPHD